MGEEVSHSEELLLQLKRKVNEGQSGVNDLKILVGKEKKVFYASTFLLATRSELFEKMFFKSGMKEQQTKVWELPEAKPETFLYFLEYLSTGKVLITAKVSTNLKKLSFWA